MYVYIVKGIRPIFTHVSYKQYINTLVNANKITIQVVQTVNRLLHKVI